MSGAPSVGSLLAESQARLAAAGVASPGNDARLLLGDLLGCMPNQLDPAGIVGADDAQRFVDMVDRRCGREPLQHILGKSWFRRLELEVGSGVFVPRPETEILVDLALGQIRGMQCPTVVDLCTGSAAIALSIATEATADVVAVEIDDDALRWAVRNLGRYSTQIDARGSSLVLVQADACSISDDRPDLIDQVDVLTCNPPYIPTNAVPRDPEVQLFDPPVALYGGPDGLDLVRLIADQALLLVRVGGLVLIEHGDEQGGMGGVPEVLVNRVADRRRFSEIRDHHDLNGRPRITSARVAEAIPD